MSVRKTRNGGTLRSLATTSRERPVSSPIDRVDEMLPAPKLFALGLQHVLVMYANAVAVPLIVGGALHLPKATPRNK